MADDSFSDKKKELRKKFNSGYFDFAYPESNGRPTGAKRGKRLNALINYIKNNRKTASIPKSVVEAPGGGPNHAAIRALNDYISKTDDSNIPRYGTLGWTHDEGIKNILGEIRKQERFKQPEEITGSNLGDFLDKLDATDRAPSMVENYFGDPDTNIPEYLKTRAPNAGTVGDARTKLFLDLPTSDELGKVETSGVFTRRGPYYGKYGVKPGHIPLRGDNGEFIYHRLKSMPTNNAATRVHKAKAKLKQIKKDRASAANTDSANTVAEAAKAAANSKFFNPKRVRGMAIGAGAVGAGALAYYLYKKYKEKQERERKLAQMYGYGQGYNPNFGQIKQI